MAKKNLEQIAVKVVAERMRAQFAERTKEIDVVLVAMLARENVCLLGIAGTGKSALLREVAASVEGATSWETLLNKFSVPEQIVGPWKLSKLKQDIMERNTDRTILDCHFAFVDEVFKGNVAIQNLMLPIMNERRFHNGQHVMDLPLRMIVAASNEMPETGVGLEAAWDRYLLREVVSPIMSDPARLQVMRASVGPRPAREKPALTLEQLDAACEQVQAMPIDDGMLSTVLRIRRSGEDQGIVYGDRRWVKIVRVLQAHAYLCGATEVTEDHIDILESAIWNTPDQRITVSKLLSAHVAPQIQEARSIADMVLTDAAKQAQGGTADDLVKAMAVLKGGHARIKNQLERTKIGSRAHTRVSATLAEVASKFNETKAVVQQATARVSLDASSAP